MPPKRYNLKEESMTLKSLQDNENIIILKSDKDNSTVIMDKVENSKKKLADLISSGGDCKVHSTVMNMERNL